MSSRTAAGEKMAQASMQEKKAVADGEFILSLMCVQSSLRDFNLLAREVGLPHSPRPQAVSADTGTITKIRDQILTPATASDKQDTLLAKETGHFSLIKAMHLADLITEMNGFCGVMSVFSSMRYMAANDPTATGNILAALAFIPLGFFFDGMDGAVARKRKTSSLMGQELDSLADLVTLPFFCCRIAGKHQC